MITIIWIACVQKNYQIRTLQKQLLVKYRFSRIATYFSYSEKMYFFKYNWNFLDQLLLPYKFHSSNMRGILFFDFASCEPFYFMYHVYHCLLMYNSTFLLWVPSSAFPVGVRIVNGLQLAYWTTLFEKSHTLWQCLGNKLVESTR